jgi:hypothetical protein
VTPQEALNILGNIAVERAADARREGQGFTAEMVTLNARAAIDTLQPIVTKAMEPAKPDA